jgi:hypothetical protein
VAVSNQKCALTAPLQSLGDNVGESLADDEPLFLIGTSGGRVRPVYLCAVLKWRRGARCDGFGGMVVEAALFSILAC